MDLAVNMSLYEGYVTHGQLAAATDQLTVVMMEILIICLAFLLLIYLTADKPV